MDTRPTAGFVKEFLKTEKQGWRGGRGDPHRIKIWDKSDDIRVRKVAGLIAQKKWKVMKVCSEVIEEVDELIENLSMKEKLKESVLWSKNEKEKHKVWKARNIRYLSLKETMIVQSRPWQVKDSVTGAKSYASLLLGSLKNMRNLPTGSCHQN